MRTDAFEAFARKMADAGLLPLQIEAFRRAYGRLRQGERGLLRSHDLEPVEDLPRRADLPPPDQPARYLRKLAVLRLNGGLGTTMGLEGPKSLLPVKEGLTFLDLLVRQVLHLRRQSGCRVPLLLLNSFATSGPTRQALAAYPDLQVPGLPLEVLQSRVPKVRRDDLSPATWPADPELEWNPPGHGEVYLALYLSGALQALLSAGFRYLFLANADNLGAVADAAILAWMADEGLPFVMEVTRRREADRKGGHLARRRRDGRLVLRETAQCPPEEWDDLADIQVHRYFNTNNLWLDLEALAALLEGVQGLLELDLIVNPKTLDPRDPTSPPVYQLESAMGSAISHFEGARALEVERSRFTPVKGTGDLLAVWSDAYELGPDGRLSLGAGRDEPPVVDLDPRYYKLLDQFQARFPQGAPSLRECRLLRVEGDVTFEAGVRVRGQAEVVARHPGARLPAGTLVQGRLEL